MSGRGTSSGTLGAVSGADIHAVTANSLAVGVWTVFARLTGLGRVVAIAAVLGPTYFGNLFQATNSVPNLIYEFLAGNLIISLLVPRLVPHVDRSDHAGAARIAGQFLAVLLTLFAAIAAATILAGPLLLDFLSFGVADPVVQTDQRTAGWLLLVLLVPQVLLYAVAGVGMAVQHSYGRYRLATAAYSAENVGVMAVVISSAVIFGSGVAIGEATTAHLVFLGAGTTAAVAVHAGVQWWGAWRAGMLLRPRLGWRSSPEFKGLLSLCVPSLGYAGMNALRLITLIAIANSIPGGVVAFQMAMAFYYLPIAVGARPVAWAMVPHLARVHKYGPRRQFQSEWAKGFSMSAFVVVPAVLGYAVLATPMARAFSLGEMATTAGIALVAAALLPLAFGIPGETMFIHASHALYARSDARRPLRGMAMRVGLTLIGIALTAAFVEGKAILIALGCTVAFADLIGGGYLASRIVVGATDIQKRLAAAVGRSVITAAIMAVPVYFVGAIGAGDVSQSEELLLVIGAVGLGAAIYLTLQRVVFHSEELELLSSQIRSLFRRRRQ